MREKIKRPVLGLLAIVAIGGLTVGIADAAKSTKHHAKKSHEGQRSGPGHGHPPFRGGPPGATALTGDDADKAKAAALEAVPGATVRRSFKVDGDRDPSVVYVVEAAKADGSPVLVLLDTDFKLVKTLDPPPFPRGGPGGGPHGGPPHGTALTGDDADKAKAAALEAVPGATVRRSFKVDGDRDPSVVYVVDVAKADGTESHVLLDADFKLVKTVDRPAGGGPCPDKPGGRHGGPPPGAPGAGYPAGPPETTNS